MNKPKDIRKTKAFKQRRRTRMWRSFRRHAWWIILLTVLVAEVAVQIFYPADYTLPLARYNNEPFGVKHRNILAEIEQKKLMDTRVELRTSTGVQPTSLSKMGATLNDSVSFEALSEYSFEWRFVPFSILFWQPNVSTLPVEFADAPLREFSQKFAKKHSKPAKNAKISLQGDEVIATDGKVGRKIDAKALQTAVQNARYDASGVVRFTVAERTVRPTAVAADLAPLKEEAQSIIAKQISITVGDQKKTHIPTREQIASWLVLAEVEGAIQLQLNHEALQQYIAELDKSVAKPAGETIVAVVDGNEKSRQEGEVGEQINRGDFEQKISSVLFVPGQYKFVQAQLETVAPSVRYVYSYSNSEAGLQAKVQEIGRRYDVRLSLQQLDGAGWQVSYRGQESTPSASTYKLYVALRLFHEMDQGRTHWGADMMGTTVAGCFDQMIIVSTNQCAEEWLRQFGRAEVNSFLYERGISQVTTFTSSDATRTSADDLVRVVRGIYDGSLVSGPNRDKLLEMMSRQVWRNGIPAGTKGWTSDKVGFLWDYVHDVGVVHHPRGTYVMAVMTKGASYGIIAQITRELEALMYP